MCVDGGQGDAVLLEQAVTMSGFFDRVEQDHRDALGGDLEFEEDEYDPPEWLGHPHAVVPGRSNQMAALFRTEVATLVLCCIDAYPIGIEFSLLC